MINVLIPIFTLVLGFSLTQLKEYFLTSKSSKKEMYFEFYVPFISLYVKYNRLDEPLNFGNKEFQDEIKTLIISKIAYIDSKILLYWQMFYCSFDSENLDPEKTFKSLVKAILINSSLLEMQLKFPEKSKTLLEFF